MFYLISKDNVLSLNTFSAELNLYLCFRFVFTAVYQVSFCLFVAY